MPAGPPNIRSGLRALAISVAAAILLAGHLFAQAYTPLPLPWIAATSSLGAVCANPSGKQAWLAQDAQAPGVTDIDVGNADQSDAQTLRQEPANTLPGNFDTLLSLTGDASRLAYVTANSLMLDDAHIWYIDLAKPATVHKLADVAVGLWIVQPVWSPDKQRLAYVRVGDVAAQQNKTQVELWVAQVNGRPARLATLPDLPVKNFYGDRRASLCWAADNRTLIVQNVAAEEATVVQATPGQSQTAAGTTAPTSSAVLPATPATTRQSTVSSTSAAGVTATTSSQAESSAAGRLTPIPTVAAAARSSPTATSATRSSASSSASTTTVRQVEIDTGTGQHRSVDQREQPAAPPPPERSQITTAGTACSVPALMQMDPRWRWQIMQSGGDSIGSYGCALTSTTMLLDFYGLSMTPDQLSECLHADADLLQWWKVSGCTKGVVRFVQESDFDWQILDNILVTGTPAILGFLGGPAGMHWVVVTAGGGGDGRNYAVIDPWDATTDKTLQYFINRGYKPSWIVQYTGPGNPCSSRLIVTPGQPAIARPAAPTPTPITTPRPGPSPVPSVTASAGLPTTPLLAAPPGTTASPHPLATMSPVLAPAPEAWRPRGRPYQATAPPTPTARADKATTLP